MLTLIFILEKKKIKGDKSIKITANNPNNPKLQHLPPVTNNQIIEKSPNNTKKIQITQKKPNNILKSPKMKLQQQISPNKNKSAQHRVILVLLLLLLLLLFL